MEYISLGKIVKVFGIKGEVKVYSSSDFRVDRYKKGKKMYIYDENKDERIEVELASFRMDKMMDIVSFKGYDTIEKVEPFINKYLEIEKDEKSLPKGFFFHSDLKGCEVFDENNNLIGEVKEIEEYAPYKTLRIKREDKKDLLIPFVKAFIKNVDIDDKKIIVSLIEGLE